MKNPSSPPMAESRIPKGPEGRPLAPTPGVLQAFLLLLATVVAFVLSRTLIDSCTTQFGLFVDGITGLALTFLFAYRYGLRSCLRWQRARTVDLWWGGISGIGTFSFLGGVADLLARVPAFQLPAELSQKMWEQARITDVPDLFSTVVVMALLPAFYEELMFRGFVQTALVARWRPARGILVTAVLFASFHFIPWLLPFYVLVGMVFGWLCFYSGSVLPGIVGHAVHDLLLLLYGNIVMRFDLSTDVVEPAFSTPVAVGLVLVGIFFCCWSLLRLRSGSRGADNAAAAREPARP